MNEYNMKDSCLLCVHYYFIFFNFSNFGKSPRDERRIFREQIRSASKVIRKQLYK